MVLQNIDPIKSSKFLPIFFSSSPFSSNSLNFLSIFYQNSFFNLSVDIDQISFSVTSSPAVKQVCLPTIFPCLYIVISFDKLKITILSPVFSLNAKISHFVSFQSDIFQSFASITSQDTLQLYPLTVCCLKLTNFASFSSTLNLYRINLSTFFSSSDKFYIYIYDHPPVIIGFRSIGGIWNAAGTDLNQVGQTVGETEFQCSSQGNCTFKEFSKTIKVASKKTFIQIFIMFIHVN